MTKKRETGAVKEAAPTKLRLLDMSSYPIEVKSRDEKTGKDTVAQATYDVKDSLVEVLFSAELHLSARQLLDRDDLARKIRDCANGELLLEKAEYDTLAASVNGITGFSRYDVEFVRRVLNTPEVEVEPKQAKTGDPSPK